MISPLTRWMLGLQVAMLRRNWMGGMGNFVMVITTTGRRSGRPIATPIGYVRDNDSYLAHPETASTGHAFSERRYTRLTALPRCSSRLRTSAPDSGCNLPPCTMM